MSEVGSIAIGAWLVRIVLAFLIVQAVIETKYRTAAVAVAFGLVGWFGVGALNAGLVTPFLAIVDIVLVLVVLGRDIRLN